MKGKVIGPTFRFNQSSLEFRRFREDDSVFESIPNAGTPAPKQIEKIVKFTPFRDGFVSNSLIMDIPSVKDDMFRVPIVTDVVLPKVYSYHMKRTNSYVY